MRAQKSLSFRFHEILRYSQDDRLFWLRPKENEFGAYLLTDCASSKTWQNRRPRACGAVFLTFTHSRDTYTRNVLIQSALVNGMCLFRVSVRKANAEISAELASHTSPFCKRLQQVAIICLLAFVFLFPTRQKLRFHLSYSHTSSLVFDVREPLCVKYENAWHCVAQAATQAKWHNKGTILIYASAACLPCERRTIL